MISGSASGPHRPPIEARHQRPVVVIPARGGSKGLRAKNLLPIAGVPLVARAVRAARGSPIEVRVIVSTDDDTIAAVARAAGAEVLARPAPLADDQASSESVVLHALDELEAADGTIPDVCVLVQCTSPFIDPGDVAATIELVRSGQADSAFTAVASHAFLWREGPTGADGINHDPAHRLRRQDRDPELRETGAVYAMRATGLRQSGSRFFGTIRAHVVPAARAVEIDDRFDYELAARLVGPTEEPDALAALSGHLGAVIFDFDGVMTDDAALVSDDGRESVRVRRSDGLGVELLRNREIPMLILSKERNQVVKRRAEKLRVACVSGCDDKWAALQAWLADRGLTPAQVTYVGNDVNDRSCLEGVGCPVVVADAHPSVLPLARVVLGRAGGEGAVRELCDLVLTALDHEGT